MTSQSIAARPLAWIVASALLAACSSSSSGDSGATDSASGGDVGGDTGGAVGDTAVVTDTAGGTDGAGSDTAAGDTGSKSDSSSACDMPAGGAACDPGNIDCNGTPCDTTSHYCCAATGTTATCVANSAACTDNAIHCDEKADCPGGKICCLVAKSFSSADSSCLTACSGGLFSAQLCKTNSECGAGGACKTYTCGTDKVEACSAIPGCS